MMLHNQQKRKRSRGRPWDWNDQDDHRTVLRFRHHDLADPTADQAIYNIECQLLGLDILEERYPTLFAVARQEPFNNDQLEQERAALKRQQAHLTHA